MGGETLCPAMLIYLSARRTCETLVEVRSPKPLIALYHVTHKPEKIYRNLLNSDTAILLLPHDIDSCLMYTLIQLAPNIHCVHAISDLTPPVGRSILMHSPTTGAAGSIYVYPRAPT